MFNVQGINDKVLQNTLPELDPRLVKQKYDMIKDGSDIGQTEVSLPYLSLCASFG